MAETGIKVLVVQAEGTSQENQNHHHQQQQPQSNWKLGPCRIAKRCEPPEYLRTVSLLFVHGDGRVVMTQAPGRGKPQCQVILKYLVTLVCAIHSVFNHPEVLSNIAGEMSA